MVAGLKFLSKKSFNPANNTNQKQVWEAQQTQKREETRRKERERQLQLERDNEELARARDGTRGGDRAKLSFMYDVPSSTSGTGKTSDHEEQEPFAAGAGGATVRQSVQSSSNTNWSYDRKSGDDDAAAAFRRMLASGNSTFTDQHQEHESSSTGKNEASKMSSLILSGSTMEQTNDKKNSSLTQLEKDVGRKNTGAALSYDEQIARFPQLKNAPMALKRKDGKDTTAETANVNFKPLGAQIRNVRCLKCGIWGHSRGDRECKLSGWDPFSGTTAAPLLPSKAAAADKDNDREGGGGPIKEMEEKRKYDSDDSNSIEYEKKRRRKKSKHSEKDRRRRSRKKTSKKRKKSRSREESDYSSDSDSYSSDSASYRRRRSKKKRKSSSRR